MAQELETKKVIDLSKYDFAEAEGRRAFIENEESSLYGGTDVDGNTVSVGNQKGVGMEITTYQSNGWARTVEYNQLGLAEGETFEKYETRKKTDTVM